MKKIALMFLAFSVFKAFGQNTYCDSLQVFSNMPFETQQIKSTKDHIALNHSELKSHISNRNQLLRIPTVMNIGNETAFSDTIGNDVIIKFDSRPIEAKKFFHLKPKSEKYSNLFKDPESTPYGIMSEDTTANLISSIEINKKQIDQTVFFDLLNPNRFYTYLAIKPIEAYLSTCKKYIYIYIFGDIKRYYIEPFDALGFSYMAKLIFTNEGEYIGRIVEKTENLRYFGFYDCPFFIGF